MANLSRLRWDCRRGLKELDTVLEKYLDDYYQEADEDEKRIFSQLLKLEDPHLYAMLLDYEQPEDPAQKALITKLGRLFQ